MNTGEFTQNKTLESNPFNLGGLMSFGKILAATIGRHCGSKVFQTFPSPSDWLTVS